MTREYLSGNALNRYPFDDNCNMTSSLGYVLPNDVFLDIMYLAKGFPNAYLVYLTNFENDTTLSKINLTFTVTWVSGLVDDEYTVSFDHVDIVEKETLVAETVDYIIKIIPGPGLETIVAGSAVDHDFVVGNAKLTTSATIQPSPRVSSIKLYNNGVLFKTITEDNINDIDFEWEEGANVRILNDSGVAAIDIEPGFGTGLYDGCDDDLVITTINEITPDPFGNFLFFTDGCYTSEKITNGLSIENICTPKCTSEQMTNFAHYLNRVKDGMDTIAAVATDMANELKTQIADYIATTAVDKNKPYFKISYTKYPSYYAGQYYFSVVVGLLNPSEENIPVTVSATSSGTIVTETIRFKSGDVSEVLGSASYTGTVPCIGVGRLEFTVFGAIGATVSVTGSLDGIAFSDGITLN